MNLLNKLHDRIMDQIVDSFQPKWRGYGAVYSPCFSHDYLIQYGLGDWGWRPPERCSPELQKLLIESWMEQSW